MKKEMFFMRKKLTSLLISLVLFGMLSFPAMAATCNENLIEDRMPMGKEALTKLAVNYFPEYADNILGNDIFVKQVQNFDDAQAVPIIVETKNISENETITYQQYRDGRSLCSYTWLNEKHSSGSGYTHTTGDMEVACNLGTGTIYLKGFAYTTVSGAYDKIDSQGTIVPSEFTNAFVKMFRANETSSAPARLEIAGSFPPSPAAGVIGYHDPIACDIRLDVGRDQLKVSVP